MQGACQVFEYAGINKNGLQKRQEFSAFPARAAAVRALHKNEAHSGTVFALLYGQAFVVTFGKVSEVPGNATEQDVIN